MLSNRIYNYVQHHHKDLCILFVHICMSIYLHMSSQGLRRYHNARCTVHRDCIDIMVHGAQRLHRYYGARCTEIASISRLYETRGLSKHFTFLTEFGIHIILASSSKPYRLALHLKGTVMCGTCKSCFWFSF